MGVLRLIVAVLKAFFGSPAALAAENLALRQQRIVLQRSVNPPMNHDQAASAVVSGADEVLARDSRTLLTADASATRIGAMVEAGSRSWQALPRRLPCGASCLGLWLGVLGVLAAAQAICALQPDDTNPDPDSRLGPEMDPNTLSHFEKIGMILHLSDAEAGAYEVARSRRGQIDDQPALTMFLRRVAALPQLDANEMGQLDWPAWRGLQERPDVYAGRPIRLRVYVVRAIRWEPGKHFVATADWPRDRGPVWRYDCLNAEAPKPADEPIYVLSATDPNTFLGPPREIGLEGDWVYSNPNPMMLAGVFYKIYDGKDTTGLERAYPVVIAWQIQRAPVLALGGTGGSGLAILILLLVVAAGFFFWRTRRSVLAARRPRAGQALPQRAPQEEGPVPDGPVDPDLAAAAEDFRKGRQQGP